MCSSESEGISEWITEVVLNQRNSVKKATWNRLGLSTEFELELGTGIKCWKCFLNQRCICRDEVCCDSSTRFAKPEGAPCDPLGTFEDSCGSGKCDGVTTGRCPNLEKKNGDNCLLHGFNGQCYEGNCLSFEIQCARYNQFYVHDTIFT